MEILQQTIKIQHEKFGVLLNQTYVDPVQFKLFLKMINGCLVEKSDFTFFNGEDFLTHIPYKFLVDSIILTNLEPYSLSEHVLNKTNYVTDQRNNK